MYHGKIERFDWRFALRIIDIAGVVLALGLSLPFWNHFAPLWWGERDPVPISWATLLSCIFYAIAELVAFQKSGLYAWQCFISRHTLMFRLAVAMIMAGVAVGLIRLFVAPTAPFYAGLWFLTNLVFAYGIIFGLRMAMRAAFPRLLLNEAFERIAFVGWSSRLETVLRALVKEMRQYQKVVGCIAEGANLDPQPGHNHPVLGSLSDLSDILKQQRISMLVVDQSNVSPKDMRLIADIAADRFVTLRMIPSAFDIWASRLNLRVVAGIPLIGINDLQHDHFTNRLMKRSMDLAGAIVGLTLAAPAIAVLAVLIKRESPGPVFYRQTRLGLNGRPFQIIKLRSMKIASAPDAAPGWTVENDPRRLKIGTFMRRWNLDELPQFWNVLKGEMSLVGPRPEQPEFVTEFRDTIRYYNLRHACKPGITGWAAVHGLRGDTSIEERIEYDLFYVENWSMLLDCKIIFMTLAPPKNAY